MNKQQSKVIAIMLAIAIFLAAIVLGWLVRIALHATPPIHAP